MAPNVFSVTIFLLVFRETLEASVIVSVLLGLVKQIVYDETSPLHSTIDTNQPAEGEGEADDVTRKRRLLRKLRLQIFAGAGLGFFTALAIGAAFIAVWFTQASNLWAQSEELWEGIFALVASVIIMIMAVAMLKMDRARAKWRYKLQKAFEGKKAGPTARAERWVLFALPFITVLREGLEAVVFVGGVAVGEPATAIPLATIIGIICGVTCGYLIYTFASRSTFTIFLIVITNFLLLIGAGLFSRGIWALQKNAFNTILGGEAGESAGDGPGTFDVRGNVWHIECCNPETSGWTIFGGLFGWTNSATLGSVLGYVFYWLTAIVLLVYLKWKEGRTKILGKESAAGRALREKRAATKAAPTTTDKPDSASEKNSVPEHEVAPTSLPHTSN